MPDDEGTHEAGSGGDKPGPEDPITPEESIEIADAIEKAEAKERERRERERRAAEQKAFEDARAGGRADAVHSPGGQPGPTGPGGPLGDRFRVDARGCRRASISALAFLVALLILIFVVCDGDDEEAVSVGDDGTVVATTQAATTAATEGTTAPTATAAPEPEPDEPASTGDEVLDELLEFFGISPEDEEGLSEVEDDLQDLIDSIRELLPAYQGRDVDIRKVIKMLLEDFNSAPFSSIRQVPSPFDCGGTGPLVVCSDPALAVPDGDILIVAMEVDDTIPLASTERSYIYSIVFDSDGLPENNWVFNPPFEFDYFQGTDRWYQAVYSHETGMWVITLTQLEADGSFPTDPTPLPTAARLAIDGRWAVWFIPTSELAVFPAPFRVTAFAHDGFFTQDTRGGDVLGPDPTAPLEVPEIGRAVMIGG